MIAQILLDTRLFSESDLAWRSEILEEAKSLGIVTSTEAVSPTGKLQEYSILTLINVGAAVAGVVIATLSLMKRPRDQWTYRKLVDEVDSFLETKDIESFRIVNVDDFGNLKKSNGKPCVVTIKTPEGVFHRLYLGLTDEIFLVSAVHFDSRSL